jgi:hypothetical protein
MYTAKVRCIVWALVLFSTISVDAQSYIWGIKGGLTVGTQRWTSFSARSGLFRYHGDLFIENWSEEDKFALGAQIGYHPRGSGLQFFGYSNGTSGSVRSFTQRYIFNNAVLSVYAKQKFTLNDKFKGYYAIGLRGEYTFSSNLPSVNDLAKGSVYNYTPIKENIRPWNFGPLVVAGLQFNYSELVGGFLEFNVSPDLSRQYYQVPINNVILFDPFTGNAVPGSIPEQVIRNISLEITFGFRFLRKIEYID